MVNSMRSAAWLVMAFSLGLVSVIVLSYQTSFSGGPGAVAATTIADPSAAEKPVPVVFSPEREVALAVEGFRKAMVEAKPESIIEHSSPSLSFGHSNGYIQTREQFAETVRSGEEVFYDIEVRQIGSRFIRPNSGYKVKLSPEHRYFGEHDSIRLDMNGLDEIIYKQMVNRAGGSSVSLYDDIAHIEARTPFKASTDLQQLREVDVSALDKTS